MSIESVDKELLKKIREIWNKIIELIGINNAKDFVKTNLDADEDKFIMVDLHKNTSFVEGNYNKNINKNTIKIYNQCMYTIIIIKTFLLFFFNI